MSRITVPQGVRYQPVRRSWSQKLLRLHRLLHYAKGFISGQYLLYIQGRMLPMLALLIPESYSICQSTLNGL